MGPFGLLGFGGVQRPSGSISCASPSAAFFGIARGSAATSSRVGTSTGLQVSSSPAEYVACETRPEPEKRGVVVAAGVGTRGVAGFNELYANKALVKASILSSGLAAVEDAVPEKASFHERTTHALPRPLVQGFVAAWI